MGTTVEQYRAHTGRYNNAGRKKDFSRSEHLFWNTKGTLIVLARSLYLLGCIVYVALLLRIANDVEENPRPTLYDIVHPRRLFVQNLVNLMQGNLDKMLVSSVLQCH